MISVNSIDEKKIRVIVENVVTTLLSSDRNTSSSEEGVIKFKLNHEKKELDKTLYQKHYIQLESWRNVLFQLKLIGCDINRYGGCGYGNISLRAGNSGISNQFLITGTQTGHLEKLSFQEYSLVNSFNIDKNSMTSIGMALPSSESLSHAVLYQASGKINSVFHVHHPELWQKKDELKIPQTSPDIPYGTVEMAIEIGNLYKKNQGGFTQKKIMAMGGHEDGLITFGKDPHESALILLAWLAKAYIPEMVMR
jgi:hypothetical protein